MISASIAARGRNKSITIARNSLQRSNIPQRITRFYVSRQPDGIYDRDSYSNKSVAELTAMFDYDRLIKRFGRVEDFGEIQDDYKSWTFWTYTQRATKVFGPLGKPILGQLRRYRQNIRRRAVREIEKAASKR